MFCPPSSHNYADRKMQCSPVTPGRADLLLTRGWLRSRRRRRHERAVAVVAVGRPVDLWRVWLVRPEASVDRRLAPAIGENNGEVRNDDRTHQWDGGDPAQVISKQQDGREEADRADAH